MARVGMPMSKVPLSRRASCYEDGTGRGAMPEVRHQLLWQCESVALNLELNRKLRAAHSKDTSSDAGEGVALASI
jgi:hypothetical protein